MLSTYKSFHSIRILFTILLLLVHFCLVFCPDPNPILPDLNAPYIEQYVEQVLKIHPEVLEEKHKPRWLQRPNSDEFLQGDETLTTYAISKFHEMYPAEDYQLESKVLDGGILISRFRRISGDKTLYLLSNSEIPIYFTIGGQYMPDLIVYSKPLQLSFWMFETYLPPHSACLSLKKHLIGVAFTDKSIEKKKAFMKHLETTDEKEHFLIPKNRSMSRAKFQR